MADQFLNLVIITLHRTRREHFILYYPDERRRDAQRQLGRWASHPDLDFSWYDAANGSQKIVDLERQPQ